MGATVRSAPDPESAIKSGEVAVLGVFDDRLDRAPKSIAGVPVLGDTDRLIGHRIMPYVDRIVITVSSLARTRVRDLVERLGVLPNDIMLLVDYEGPESRSAACRLYRRCAAGAHGRPAQRRAQGLGRRLQDLVIGVIALICSCRCSR